MRTYKVKVSEDVKNMFRKEAGILTLEREYYGSSFTFLLIL